MFYLLAFPLFFIKYVCLKALAFSVEKASYLCLEKENVAWN